MGDVHWALEPSNVAVFVKPKLRTFFLQFLANAAPFLLEPVWVSDETITETKIMVSLTQGLTFEF